jgi:hypothetical protein
VQSPKRFQASIRGEAWGMPRGVGGIELPEHPNPEQGGVEGRLRGKFCVDSSDVAPARTRRSRCAILYRAASAFVVTECEQPACAEVDESHPRNPSMSAAMRQPRARCAGTCDLKQIVSEDPDWFIRLWTWIGQQLMPAIEIRLMVSI